MNLDIFWTSGEGRQIACTRNISHTAVAEIVRGMLAGNTIESGDTISFRDAAPVEDVITSIILADRQKAP